MSVKEMLLERVEKQLTRIADALEASNDQMALSVVNARRRKMGFGPLKSLDDLVTKT